MQLKMARTITSGNAETWVHDEDEATKDVEKKRATMKET